MWSLPGYEVEVLLGTGGTAEVWRGRELSSGQPVALKRLRDGADPEALRREAAVLQSLHDCPYVIGLRDVVRQVLVLDLAAGGSLASLLVRRGSLEPGEVVTVAAPIAQALAAVHARGLVHGDVSPSNVLLTAEGMPLLSDVAASASLATAEYLDPALAAGAAPSPASDIWSLAALCHHLLAGSPPHEGNAVPDVLRAAGAGRRAPLGLLAPAAPRALVETVEAALVRDPALRPDAVAFASALRRAHAAEPVRFDGVPAAVPMPDVRPTHGVPRHAAPSSAPLARPRAVVRRRPAWLVPGAVGVVLVLSAALLGWWWGRSPSVPAAAPLPVPAVAEPAWPQVLDDLDATRAQAFAAADPAALAGAYEDGSPGLAADRALVEQLARQQYTAAGVRHEVRQVRAVSVEADRARLRVVDVLGPYDVRDARGSVVSRFPGRGEAAYEVELARGEQGWRLVQVRPG